MIKEANVYVHGWMLGLQTKATFAKEIGYKIVPKLEQSDIVVWTGGEDIYPGLYGEKPIYGVHYSTERDKDDVKVIEAALKENKFLVGICRGAQLLNVIPNGGKLWQDVDGHHCVHTIFDTLTNSTVKTNSVHHQAMRITSDAQLIAWATISKEKESQDTVWRRPKGIAYPGHPDEFDVEACWYPKTKSLCVQFHPEFGHTETTSYFFNLMDHFYWHKDVIQGDNAEAAA